MKSEIREPRICPKCGRSYTERPSLSRVEDIQICPDCGTREALDAIGVSAEEQEKIISIIHRNYAE